MKKTFVRLNLLLTLLHCFASLMGQVVDSVEVRCHIIDSLDSSPVVFATVAVENVQGGRVAVGQTDGSGNCLFRLPPKQLFALKVRYLGYKDTVFSLDIGSDASFEIKLVPAATTLNGVTISAIKPVFTQEPGKLVMTVGNTTLVQGSNMLEVLQKAPGITTDMDGRLNFRGKQGVLVLIDNKNTYLSGEELSRFLESQSGANIEKIEIISNPSARFDASGNIGVINIVTKRIVEKQFSGNVQGSATYGNYFRPSASLQLNARPDDKWTFQGILNSAQGKTRISNSSSRIVSNTSGQLILEQGGKRLPDRLDNSAKLSANYSSGKHTLGVQVNGFFNENDVDNYSDTKVRSSQLDSIVKFTNKSASDWANISGNLYYQIKIDTSGKLLDINADYAHFKYDGIDNMTSRFLYPNLSELRPDEVFRNLSPSDVGIASIKADYTHPLKPGSYIQAGAKFSRANTDNNLIFENRNSTGVWENDKRRSNHFLFDEDISAAYVDYYNRIGAKWDYGVGVRYEYSISKVIVGVLIDQTTIA
jgi:hypothetical protein